MAVTWESERFNGHRTANGTLLRTMWPTVLPTLSFNGKEKSQMQAFEVVPEDDYAVDDWAYVCPRKDIRDISRRSIYVLSEHPQATPDEVFEVAIRLQGFVKSCCLTPLGNWKRYRRSLVITRQLTYLTPYRNGGVNTASSADQKLVLFGGNSTDIFKLQVDALNLVRSSAFNHLCGKDVTPLPCDIIATHRRVFTRVSNCLSCLCCI